MALSSVLYRYLWVLPVIITAVIVTVLATTKNHNGVRQIVLAGIGLLLGMTLSYFDYSFTTTFRQLLVINDAAVVIYRQKVAASGSEQ